MLGGSGPRTKRKWLITMQGGPLVGIDRVITPINGLIKG